MTPRYPTGPYPTLVVVTEDKVRSWHAMTVNDGPVSRSEWRFGWLRRGTLVEVHVRNGTHIGVIVSGKNSGREFILWSNGPWKKTTALQALAKQSL